MWAAVFLIMESSIWMLWEQAIKITQQERASRLLNFNIYTSHNPQRFCMGLAAEWKKMSGCTNHHSAEREPPPFSAFNQNLKQGWIRFGDFCSSWMQVRVVSLTVIQFQMMHLSHHWLHLHFHQVICHFCRHHCCRPGQWDCSKELPVCPITQS